MADLITKDDLDNKPKANQAQGLTSGQAPSQANQTPQNSSQAQQAGMAQRKQGTGFTNIGRILQANQGNRLGQTIGQGLQNTAQGVKSNLQAKQQDFSNQYQQQQQGLTSDKALRQSALQTLSGDDISGIQNLQNQAQDFSRIREGAYSGPTGIQDLSAVQAQANEAAYLGNSLRSDAGRQALLQRFAGGQGYNSGQQKLDTLFLGQQINPLRQNIRQVAGLGNQVQNTADAAAAQAKALAAEKAQLGQETTKDFTGQKAAVDTDINKALTAAQIQEQRRIQNEQDMRDLFSGQGLSEIKDAQGNVIRAAGEKPANQLAATNQALQMAMQNGIINQEDFNRINALNQTLGTPVETLLRQKISSGSTGMLGFGRPGESVTYTGKGDPRYSNLKLENLLRDSLSGVEAKNLTTTGVANDLQATKANAIARLLGGNADIFAADRGKYASGAQNFDLTRAEQQANEDIARLRNEAPIDLPTQYDNVSTLEKLRNTVAPELSQVIGDTAQDTDKLFSGDTSAGERAASIARLASLPIRAPAGVFVNNVAQPIASGVLGDVNKAFGSNQSLGSRAVGLGSLALAPVLAPARAIQSVASSIGNIFCYAKGTKIRMKDGSMKLVEDLEIGDEVLMGGKVLGSGETLVAELYEYKGNKVTGTHSVFEGDKFIRVEDSKLSKKIDAKEGDVVYPVVTEKHLLVTDSHIGSDFSEVDEGSEITPEKRMKKLNSDKERLDRLSMATYALFGKKV